MSLRIAIITSLEEGVASHHVPLLVGAEENYQVVLVVLNRSLPLKDRSWWRRKLRKSLKIGPLGVLSGFRMRKWYGTGTTGLLGISPLKGVCDQLNKADIYHEVKGLNSLEMEHLLANHELDLAVSLGNGFIAPRIFSIPRFGMLNVHHEELPKFRNAQSVIWQLYEGSNKSGYTIHEIEREIDGGRILKKSMVPIEFAASLGKTVSLTYASLWNASASGLCQVLNAYPEYVRNASNQVGGGHYTTPSFLQFLRIWRNWNMLRRK